MDSHFREKGRKAQTAKLLRVVQKRLSGEDSGAVIGAKDSSIGIGGGEHDFIKAAPKVHVQTEGGT